MGLRLAAVDSIRTQMLIRADTCRCNQLAKDKTMPNETTIEDYEHWGEEASLVKAQEDRFADYYSDPYDDYDPYEPYN